MSLEALSRVFASGTIPVITPQAGRGIDRLGDAFANFGVADILTSEIYRKLMAMQRANQLHPSLTPRVIAYGSLAFGAATMIAMDRLRHAILMGMSPAMLASYSEPLLGRLISAIAVGILLSQATFHGVTQSEFLQKLLGQKVDRVFGFGAAGLIAMNVAMVWFAVAAQNIQNVRNYTFK